MKIPWKKKPGRSQDEAVLAEMHNRPRGVVHLTHNDFDAVGCDAIHRRVHSPVTTIFCSVGRFPHVMGIISGIGGEGDTLSISDLGYFPDAESVVDSIRKRGGKGEDLCPGVHSSICPPRSLETALAETWEETRPETGSYELALYGSGLRLHLGPGEPVSQVTCPECQPYLGRIPRVNFFHVFRRDWRV